MNYRLVFRSPFGQVTAAVIGVVALIFMGMIWASDGFAEMLRAAPLPLGLAYFTWWVWAWPEVIADRRGIEVRNQLRTFRIGWGALRKAEARFGLYLYTNGSVNEVESASDSGSGEDGPRTGEGVGEVALANNSENQDRPNLRGPLTIGEVDPVNLDPDGLANRKPIYVAGVPARGGLKTATQKHMPEVPTLDLTARNRVVLRVSPLVAARILEEEKHYVANPSDRPEVHQSREDFPGEGEAFSGATATTNWGLIGVFVAFAAYLGVLLAQALG